MTVSLKHAFTSPKSDGTDSTLVQPSNWNAEHTLSLAAGKVLGRDSSGAGTAQELAISVDSTQQSMIPPSGTTAQRPSSAAAGMMRYNTTTSKFEGYTSSWGTLGGGCTISDTAPSNPQAGDLWWKSDEAQMYVYYNDGTSSQWVIANAFAGGSAIYLQLSGGTLTGTLNGTAASFSGNVTAGTLNTRTIGGTTANSLVALDASAKLPAVDGSQLTSLVGSQIATLSGSASSTLRSGTAVASTSGTAIDFTGIPSWAKRITVLCNGMSTSGTSIPIIQLGVSGTPETTGYSAIATVVTVTSNTTRGSATSTGFPYIYATGTGASETYSGSHVISLLSPNVWTCSGLLYDAPSSALAQIAGVKSLAGTLNMIRITTVNGTDTFDAGSINIMWE